MTTRMLVAIGGIGFLAACGGSGADAEGAELPGDESTVGDVAVAELRCSPADRMPIEGRASPYDSTLVQLGDAQAKICYGRPSAQGRTMIGGEHVPYGSLWRTGANEPTIIHLPVAASIAGIDVEPGSYSLYTEPTEADWTVIVNRSTSQWGHESAYSEGVRAQEVGRATVPSRRSDDHVETFTIRSNPAGDAGADLTLEWEHTRVDIPIRRR